MNKKHKLVAKKHRKNKERLRELKKALLTKSNSEKSSAPVPKKTAAKKPAAKKTAAKKPAAKKTAAKKPAAKKPAAKKK